MTDKIDELIEFWRDEGKSDNDVYVVSIDNKVIEQLEELKRHENRFDAIKHVLDGGKIKRKGWHYPCDFYHFSNGFYCVDIKQDTRDCLLFILNFDDWEPYEEHDPVAEVGRMYLCEIGINSQKYEAILKWTLNGWANRSGALIKCEVTPVIVEDGQFVEVKL